MTRSEIREEAKRLVLALMDRGFENYYPDDEMNRDDPRWAHREEILREADKQADRVYRFLGYEPPR